MWIVIGSSDGARKYILNRGVFPFAIIEDEWIFEFVSYYINVLLEGLYWSEKKLRAIDIIYKLESVEQKNKRRMGKMKLKKKIYISLYTI